MSETSGRKHRLAGLYEAFVTGDFEQVRKGLSSRVEYVNPADAVEPGTRIGPDAFVDALRRLHDMFDYDRYEIAELVERGDRTVSVVRFVVKGRSSDVPIDAEFTHLIAWDGPVLARLEWFRAPDEALAALG